MLGFFFRSRACFPLRVKQKSVTAAFLLYECVFSPWTQFVIQLWDLSLAVVILATIGNELYMKSNLPSECTQKQALADPNLEGFFRLDSSLFPLPSILPRHLFQLPRVRTDFRKKAFSFAASGRGILSRLKVWSHSAWSLPFILRDRQRETTEQRLCFNFYIAVCCFVAAPALFTLDQPRVTVPVTCAAHLLARSPLWKRSWFQWVFCFNKGW